jgi:nucleoside-diphosphate-sugar epimerase
MSGDLVLVTGGSGFIGVHCILRLLDAGYRVRATIRSLSRAQDVRAMLKTGGAASADAVSFVAADLNADADWPDAVADCRFVLHVASPFPDRAPEHEDDLIVPAREGTLRVLKAARNAGVKRVVLTSSFAAIGYGTRPTAPYCEQDWSDPNANVSAYVKSKTLAERAAWDFVAREGGMLELASVNPVVVLGPVLGTDTSTSIKLLQRLLDGSTPGVPRLSFGVVDVRDVADLQLLAMTHPAAKGERFLAVAGDFMSIKEIADLLRQHLGAAAARVPTRVLPNWLVRIAAISNPTVRQIVSELGKVKNATNQKSRRVLGWTPRSNEQCILASVESLRRFGLLRAP